MESYLRVLYICLSVGLLFAPLGRASPSTACCQILSKTVLRLSNIKGYHMQKAGVCPILAVVFTTVKGNRVCSDPTKSWVVRAMKSIDSKKQQATAATTEALTSRDTESTRTLATVQQPRTEGAVHCP